MCDVRFLIVPHPLLEAGEVGLFFVFRFLLFVIRFSFSAFRFFFFFFFFFLFFCFFFWQSNWGEISNFNFQNLISTFALRPSIVFWHSETYLTLELRPNIAFFFFFFFSLSLFFSLFVFRHSNWGRISLLKIKILFRHSHWDRLSYFNIRNPILTFELRLNIVFWHLKPYVDIPTEAQYRILTFEILI